MPPGNSYSFWKTFFMIPLLFFTFSLKAQEVKIVRGRVLNATKEPLPGVSVSVKGTTIGTITDADGRYSLNVATGNTTLVFSFVGYTSEEVVVINQAEINVSLVPDIKSLSEVVVVGYGTQRKAETTGAIASVKAEELVQTPVTNVAQGLQARVAGVQITQNSSAPGGNISVRIRGTNSINGTSEPLYIVDGIQIANSGGVNDVSPLSTINPNDIESVEVLKDASATAIYGSRGANGVVLITTKRGKSGVTRVTLDSYYGVQNITKKLNVMNAAEFAGLENEIYKTDVANTKVMLANRVDGLIVSLTKDTRNFDHFKVFERKGIPIVFFSTGCATKCRCPKSLWMITKEPSGQWNT